MKKINQIIAKRIEAVENGEYLLCFTEEEFDEMNKKLLAGIKPDLSKIRRIKKNEKSKIILPA